MFSGIDAFSQYSSFDNIKFNDIKSKVELSVPPKVALGFDAGFSYFNEASGYAIGLFAEMQVNNFSIIPQANYWSVNHATNFEMAATVRLRFESKSVTPYAEGGIGINFYKSGLNDANDGLTQPGIDLGGGIEIPNVFKNAVIFFDGKYKIIINDSPNIRGYTLTGGIKFDL